MADAIWHRSELTYCSNVHPGESLTAVQAIVAGDVAAVRQRRGLERMASGLWLSARAAETLQAEPSARAAFAETLAETGIELCTLNGFPYGDFHLDAVKENVYTPDWSDPQRSAYTLDLAETLAQLLPAHCAEGTISTLPLGFKPNWDAQRHQAALQALAHTAQELAALAERSGRVIRICLEMEPGCVLETTGECVRALAEELPAAAHKIGVAQDTLRAHVGVCYDVCHQAVMFEEPRESLLSLLDAGLCVGKIQVSSALRVAAPARQREALAAFAEPKYLHQVRTLDGDGKLTGTMDLDAALAPGALADDREWRVHFHVPIQARELGEGALGTTRAAIEAVLSTLADNPRLHPQLEVETYTWRVLPHALRPNGPAALHQSLADELEWLETVMSARNMLERS